MRDILSYQIGIASLCLRCGAAPRRQGFDPDCTHSHTLHEGDHAADAHTGVGAVDRPAVDPQPAFARDFLGGTAGFGEAGEPEEPV